jgi:hypothetical protein
MTDEQIGNEAFNKSQGYLMDKTNFVIAFIVGAKWMQEQLEKEQKEDDELKLKQLNNILKVDLIKNSIFSSLTETWDNESDEQMGEML